MDLDERFLAYIQNNALCDSKRDRVLVAVSGGRDSVLLLHLLVRAGIDVGIAHCNFALRDAESDADEELVRQYAANLGVPSFFKRFETEKFASKQGVSIQMAARELRYTWFESVRQQAGFDYIAVAHHANDNIETILINLLRGTGLRGLRGMMPKRGRIIRPLLFLDHEQVTEAVQRLNLHFRDDTSNFSKDYLRNRLRLDVIPILQEIQPELEETFGQNIDVFRDALRFIDGEIDARRQALIHPGASGEFLLDLTATRTMRPLRFVLYELLQPFTFTAAVCGDLASVLERGGAVSGRQFASETHQLLLDRAVGLIRPIDRPEATDSPADDGPVQLRPDQPEAVWKGQRLRMVVHRPDQQPFRSQDTAVFDADEIRFPLQIRAWEDGDAFRPAGMGGKTKKLSDLFVSRKIPVWQKKEIPIVTDADGTILWIVPFRMSMDYNISAETRNVLTISYFCEDGNGKTHFS